MFCNSLKRWSGRDLSDKIHAGRSTKVIPLIFKISYLAPQCCEFYWMVIGMSSFIVQSSHAICYMSAAHEQFKIVLCFT